MLRRLLAASLILAAACAARHIPGTDIRDTPDTRAIVGIIDTYRKAVEQRDAQAVLALVSQNYYDDAGTPDPADDMDYSQLVKTLPEDYKKLAAVRLDIAIKDVVVNGDHATADLYYDSHFRVNTPRGEVPKAESDVNRMTFQKEAGVWKIIRGL